MSVGRQGTQWRVDGYDAQGRRVRRRVASAETAAALAAELHRVPTFAQHAAEWLTLGAVEWKGGRRGNTFRGYEQILRVHLLPQWGPWPLTAIEPRAVELWRAALLEQVAPKTALNILSALSSIFKKARAWRLITDNPCAGLRGPKVPPRHYVWWSVDQAEQVLQVLERGGPDFWRWSRPFFTLALRTGLRLGELAGLEWCDIDFDRRVIEVRRSYSNKHLDTPKSGHGRLAPMFEDVVEVLHQHPRSTSGLVLEHRGRRLTQRVCVRQMEAVARAAQVPLIRLHDMRHTYASHLVTAGVSLPVVRELLGHSEIRTTMRYAHLAPQVAHNLARGAIERYWDEARCNTQEQLKGHEGARR